MDLVKLCGGSAEFYPYKIDQSCRFNDDDSAGLTKTFGAGVDDLKKWTVVPFFPS